MGIPGPQQARGRILYDVVEHTENLHEITILDISDWHAQLTPLAEAADNARGARRQRHLRRSAAPRT